MRHLPLGCLVVFLAAHALRGQDLSPRFGFGPEFLVNANDDDLSDRNAALGLRVRASMPINADVSAAADLGLLAFVMRGNRSADYQVNPQLSAIITLPGRSWAPYILGGIGMMVPIAGDVASKSAVTVHGGYGWARLLLETSVFAEINPALVIREESVRFVLPFRAGVIF